ncbi:MAG: helix-turn-helix domain-containing protein [Bacteroidia bacterium]|nr:helix-turn-helix domain-containing protein [Bacteroidia bacterium]NNF30572.1 helix-turn-helix domain-containing protein [Flavobacteriaceae bacterium]MBT8277094.1 helix-turn-helix domain-containing protein [Bacteroidia bacterium]NNJ81281.1 helix-turn-helix domain-containing protein [Flavobacteriaceae bacterium]NNK53107.1 helix-turn-helix domain-containing protein [Flavobacteriaceae bacterium]
MRLNLFVFIALISSLSSAQELTDFYLEESPIDSLIVLFDINAEDSVIAERIARKYISKAKVINDSTKMARGYTRLSFISKHREALKYLDTAITLSRNSDHPNFPTVPYLFKSDYLYENEEYERSLQSALTGYQYAREKSQIGHQITALHQINDINEMWGDYEKSLDAHRLTYKLLQQNKDSDQYEQNYLSSLEGLGRSFVNLKQPDSALYYFREGTSEALKTGDSATYYAFVSRSGTALYVKGNYEEALDSLYKADTYRNEFNNYYLPYYYYYVGSIYNSQGEVDEGMMYYRKIDSLYEARSIVYPELPEVYDKLISYYKEKGEYETQLNYLYKLVVVLRIIESKKRNINEKTVTDFEIPKLVEEKEQLIADLEEKNKISTTSLGWALGFLALSFGLVFYYFRRQNQYKKRFENLMENKGPEVEVEPSAIEDVGISPEIIESIMERLKKFELDKEFLSQRISLSEMAKSFESNSTYLSKVINLKKGKNFSQYINDLRIDYAVEELKDNSTFRKYTIKAIAHECGFKSAESFSKSFYKKHGIYPSYYLKQLQQSQK